MNNNSASSNRSGTVRTCASERRYSITLPAAKVARKPPSSAMGQATNEAVTHLSCVSRTFCWSITCRVYGWMVESRLNDARHERRGRQASA